jgi:hypothetical protein
VYYTGWQERLPGRMADEARCLVERGAMRVQLRGPCRRFVFCDGYRLLGRCVLQPARLGHGVVGSTGRILRKRHGRVGFRQRVRKAARLHGRNLRTDGAIWRGAFDVLLPALTRSRLARPNPAPAGPSAACGKTRMVVAGLKAL